MSNPYHLNKYHALIDLYIANVNIRLVGAETEVRCTLLLSLSKFSALSCGNNCLI